MAIDAFIQVEADGVGKKVDMDQVATAAGATIYRQRAVLVGESGDIQQQILIMQMRQLAVLRAILATLQQANNGFGITAPNVASEEEFVNNGNINPTE